MKFQIGTDEAGYGPNLGPLTIAGTLWQLPDNTVDLYQQLDSVVTRHRRESTVDRMLIADSKKVYSSGRLEMLERSVLSIVRSVFGETPRTWQELLSALGPTDLLEKSSLQPWLTDCELSLPVAAKRDEIEALSATFADVCLAAQVRLLKLHCQIIFPEQFNQELNMFGNKATLLSTHTLRIVREFLNQTDGAVIVGCDKHGGRSKYGHLIQSIVTPDFVFVGQESLAQSDYQFVESDREIKLCFSARGESFLPTALSSMIAKYVREIMMLLWNHFWRKQIPEIQPTQGYPQDAKRFKRDIAVRQQQLGISDDRIWRTK